jgi:membrane-associated protein
VQQLTDIALALASSPLLYLVVLALVIIDGFFPPVPSESVIIAVAAIAVSHGAPNIWLIAVVAALGAAVGDNIAYALGRGLGVDRFAWMRRPRVAAGIARAGRGLQRSPAALVLTARYVPIGRIAVNMTAGATGFRWARFWPLTAVGAALWSAYSVLIGIAAGHWLHAHPLPAALLGVGIAIALGIAIDRVTLAVSRRRDAARSADAHEARKLRDSPPTLEE